MTPHGQKEVEAAQADGRWACAHANGKAMLARGESVYPQRTKARRSPSRG